MKLFAISIYEYETDSLHTKVMLSEIKEVALLRAIRKVVPDMFNAYIEHTEDCNSDIGNVAAIKEFCHEVLRLNVIEVK